MKSLLALFLLAVAPAGAFAQTPVANNTAYGDWRVACRAVTTEKNECRLVQTLSKTADKSLVVRLVAVPAPDGGAVLFAQVPIGAYLAAKPALRIVKPTQEPEVGLVWQRCLKDLCEAAVQLKPEDVAAMSAADTVLFGYQMDPKAKPIVVPIGMKQFSEGLAAIRPAPSK